MRLYTSPNENFEYSYLHSNAFLRLQMEHCKPHNAACHPTKFCVINDVKWFSPVYRRIYCRKLSDVTLQKRVHIEFGPQCEKTCLRGFANYTGTDQPAHPRSLISAFVIRFLESIICKLSTGEIAIF